MPFLFMGVISKNMCLQRKSKKNLQGTTFIPLSETGSKVKPQQAVVIQSLLSHDYASKKIDDCNNNKASSVHFMSRAYTSKSIKTILVKEIAMTLQDLKVFENTPIPSGFIMSLLFPIQNCPVKLSILPTLSIQHTKPPPAHMKEDYYDDHDHDRDRDEDVVPWSVLDANHALLIGPKDNHNTNNNDVFSLHSHIGYVDFLFLYCFHRLSFVGKIEYQMYVYQKPLVFGKATISIEDGKQVSFYFGRLICCNEMCKLLFTTINLK